METKDLVSAGVVKETKGIVRGLDTLNRLVIPKEYMRKLEPQLRETREFEILMFDESTVIIKPAK